MTDIPDEIRNHFADKEDEQILGVLEAHIDAMAEVFGVSPDELRTGSAYRILTDDRDGTTRITGFVKLKDSIKIGEQHAIRQTE